MPVIRRHVRKRPEDDEKPPVRYGLIPVQESLPPREEPTKPRKLLDILKRKKKPERRTAADDTADSAENLARTLEEMEG